MASRHDIVATLTQVNTRGDHGIGLPPSGSCVSGVMFGAISARNVLNMPSNAASSTQHMPAHPAVGCLEHIPQLLKKSSQTENRNSFDLWTSTSRIQTASMTIVPVKSARFSQ